MGTQDLSGLAPNRKRYVRRLTEARREQNRRAQKVYRQRQAQQLQASQQRIGREVLSRKHGLALKQPCEDTNSDIPSVAKSAYWLSQDLEVDRRGQGIDDLEKLLQVDSATDIRVSEQSIDYATLSWERPDYDFSAVALPLAPSVLLPADPMALDMRGMWPLPLHCYQQTYTLPERPKPLSRPASAHHRCPSVTASSRLDISHRGHSSASQPSALPDPYMNYLQILGESCFAATMAIAVSLGINRPSYINDHPSPFALAPFADYAHISRDLQPTFEQRTLVHPRYLDCIIFPNFRSRAIELSSRGELDHCSLFLDLMHDGLVCWGSQYTSAKYGRSVTDAVPWSRQSWEAKPWFLKKWSFLIGDGDPDCMQSISGWWSAMRGEEEVLDATVEETGSVFSRHGGCNVGIRQTYDAPLEW